MFLQSLKMLLTMTFLTGLVYPLAVTGISQLLMKDQANGNLIVKDGKIRGSSLIGQKFESERYFWSRPSAIDYNPLPSGGTNLGPTSVTLNQQVAERISKLNEVDAPKDLLFASGSGLDPHISLKGASLQIKRVAKARALDEQKLSQLVESSIEKRQFEVLGEERINVLLLNMALDNMR